MNTQQEHQRKSSCTQSAPLEAILPRSSEIGPKSTFLPMIEIET
jgi:hypothetical protein